MSSRIWKRWQGGALPPARRNAVDPIALERAEAIVSDVRTNRDRALRRWAVEMGDMESGSPLWLGPAQFAQAAERVPSDVLELFKRTAGRVRDFAVAQRASLSEFTLSLEGGSAEQAIAPVRRAGCYAPGGATPLPSSLLMTAVTARTAGVDRVLVASPRPGDLLLAAAHVAGADRMLSVGGAQAIAALAFGAAGEAPVDVIVGPGNRYVTAAKFLVSASVGIDMLAGPSELLVIADEDADPILVAADLLSQAEHDEDARAYLCTDSEALADAVDVELRQQLESLARRTTARRSLAQSGVIIVDQLPDAVSLSDRLAPEHLQLMGPRAESMEQDLSHFGALFTGVHSAEVFGDYGAGPNHVLPTGGGARSRGGLSVLDFLRVRTVLRTDEAADSLVRDACALAKLEGLGGHANAAALRLWRIRPARVPDASR